MSGSASSARWSAVFRLLLAFAGLLFALVLAEAVLRLLRFEHRPFPVVEFGWPEPRTIADRYQHDPDLLWVTRDYQAVLAGAREGRVAVVFMGDSCTEFGTYPRETLERLHRTGRSLARGIEVGVGGWSAVQGRWQLERDILPLRPRVVTIYYGWNDHWMALGPPDAEIRRTRAIRWAAERLRLLQLVYKVRLRGGDVGTTRSNRVDVDTYQAVLQDMARQVQRAGGAAVLITAPSGHAPGREPAYLLARHLRRLEELVPLHQTYVAATRRAAAAAGAELCDAAAWFDGLPPPREQYFWRDGIHLSDAGNTALADLLAGCIARAEAARAPVS